MRETRSSGSVEGVVSDHDPYSDLSKEFASPKKRVRSAPGHRLRCVHAKPRIHGVLLLAGVALIVKAFCTEIAFKAVLGAAVRYPWS
jgi:hypothetical protein